MWWSLVCRDRGEWRPEQQDSVAAAWRAAKGAPATASVHTSGHCNVSWHRGQAKLLLCSARQVERQQQRPGTVSWPATASGMRRKRARAAAPLGNAPQEPSGEAPWQQPPPGWFNTILECLMTMPEGDKHVRSGFCGTLLCRRCGCRRRRRTGACNAAPAEPAHVPAFTAAALACVAAA